MVGGLPWHFQKCKGRPDSADKRGDILDLPEFLTIEAIYDRIIACQSGFTTPRNG